LPYSVEENNSVVGQGVGADLRVCPNSGRTHRFAPTKENCKNTTTEIKGCVMWCYEDEDKKYKYGINFIEEQNIFKTFLSNEKEDTVNYDDRRNKSRRSLCLDILNDDKTKKS
jgi:hypothetical protein